MAIVFNAVGGMLFWLVVARLENVDDVGAAQALFQAMTFITFITNMGLPVAMAHYTSPSTVNLANWMLTARAALAVGSCIVFLVVAGWAEVFAPLWQWGWLAGSATFVILGVGFAAAVLIEMRLVTLRRWRLVVGRSAVAALARLVLVIPLALGIFDGNLALWLFLIAALPISTSGYVLMLYTRMTCDRQDRLVPQRPPNFDSIMRFATVNWVGLVATQGPIFAIPLLVAFSVDSADNAPFYVAWSFGAMAFLLPQTIGQVTLSEANYDGQLSNKLIHGLKLALLLTCVASFFAQLTGGFIGDLYGPGYEELSFFIPLVVAASIPWSYTSLGLTASRIREHHGEVLFVSVFHFTTTMVPALILTPLYGAEAAVWCWVAGNTATALVVAMMYLRWKLDPENALVRSSVDARVS